MVAGALDPRERVLAVARGGPPPRLVVATTFALYWLADLAYPGPAAAELEPLVDARSNPPGSNAPAEPAAVQLSRLGWEEIGHVRWTGDTLQVRAVADGGVPAPALAVRLHDPGALPPLLRDRVNSSILLSVRGHLGPASRGVRVVARRRPGSGDLLWQLVFDSAADRSEPALLAEAEQLLAATRAEFGTD